MVIVVVVVEGGRGFLTIDVIKGDLIYSDDFKVGGWAKEGTYLLN